MKKITSAVLIGILISNIALADCDFKTDITKNDDGSYRYSKGCHLMVGQMKQDLETNAAQIADYKQAIELKNLALTKTDQRAELWMNTSFKMEEKLNKVDELQSKNAFLYTGLGVLGTVLAVWAAGQLRN